MSDDSKLLSNIFYYIRRHPYEYDSYNDAFSCIQNMNGSYKEIHSLMSYIGRGMKKNNPKLVKNLYELNRKCYMYSARTRFEDYLIAIDYDLPIDRKFYLPRKKYLKPIVDGYQDILDGKIKVMTISLPKRTGKSQTAINFINMLSGISPNKATLVEGAGDALVNSFYLGCLEYLTDKRKYNYYDIFPETKLVQTNADIKIFNLNEKSRFPTVMCRSIDATQVGLSEATNLLYMDDTVQGREEAKNRDLMDKKWEVISGDVMGRNVGFVAPMIITGTRYSLYDPIGRVQEECRKNKWNYRFIEIPALNDNDESNFEFTMEGKKYFTTEYFKEQRSMLTDEQVESEFQQQPFEAKGILFPKDSLNFYMELPVDREPDTIIAVCDTAESGSDSTSMPIAYIYGNEVYIEDVVFDDSPASKTKPECAYMLMKHKTTNVTFESNSAGTYYARDVNEILKKSNYSIGMRTKRSISNKQTRIEFASDVILKNFYFKDLSRVKRTSQYYNFIHELVTYTRSGKVPHDDAPDSLALLVNEIRGLVGSRVELIQRPF